MGAVGMVVPPCDEETRRARGEKAIVGASERRRASASARGKESGIDGDDRRRGGSRAYRSYVAGPPPLVSRSGALVVSRSTWLLRLRGPLDRLGLRRDLRNVVRDRLRRPVVNAIGLARREVRAPFAPVVSDFGRRVARDAGGRV
eukprot:6213298-Pleurochrysis_carterae.AAC.4